MESQIKKGVFMKSMRLYFTKVFAWKLLFGMIIVILTGCPTTISRDYFSETTINIKNNSSYDLRLIFTFHKQLINHNPDFDQTYAIVVEKKSTYSFKISGGLGSSIAPDPNWHFGRITFYDVNNDEMALKYIKINDFENNIYIQFNEPFLLIDIKDFKQNYQQAVYLLEITDDLWN